MIWKSFIIESNISNIVIHYNVTETIKYIKKF